jgi:hypothetical protein
MGAKSTGFGTANGPMTNGLRGFFDWAIEGNICTLNRRHNAFAYSLAKSVASASAALQYP